MPSSVLGMEPSEDVLARLDRIGELDRSGAAPGELLEALRELVGEVEARTRDCRAGSRPGAADPAPTTDDDVKEVVGRLRTALARDIIG